VEKMGAPKRFSTIRMADEQSIAVLTILPALVYFLFIYLKGSLNIFDAVVLASIYFVYLGFSQSLPLP